MLDRKSLEASGGERTRLERLRDVERTQGAALAMPAAWRTRDRIRSPEWPPLHRLDLWRSLGASHALLMRPPAVHPQDQRPHAEAYALGWVTTMNGYTNMTQQNLVAISANSASLDEVTLGNFLVSPDVTPLTPDQRAQLLVALANHVGLSPLVKPFIIIQDGKAAKIYATKDCADGLRRSRGIEVEVTHGPSVEDYGGFKMLVARATATEPKTGRGESRTALIPWQKENVTKWGEASSGKRYPSEIELVDPSPQELANLLMKVESKAIRRATFAVFPVGAVGDAEDARVSPYAEDQYAEQLPTIDAPHPDEAGA